MSYERGMYDEVGCPLGRGIVLSSSMSSIFLFFDLFRNTYTGTQKLIHYRLYIFTKIVNYNFNHHHRQYERRHFHSNTVSVVNSLVYFYRKKCRFFN